MAERAASETHVSSLCTSGGRALQAMQSKVLLAGIVAVPAALYCLQAAAVTACHSGGGGSASSTGNVSACRQPFLHRMV